MVSLPWLFIMNPNQVAVPNPGEIQEKEPTVIHLKLKPLVKDEPRVKQDSVQEFSDLSLKGQTGYTFANSSNGLMNEITLNARQDNLSVDITGNYSYFLPPGEKSLDHQLRVSFLPKLHLKDKGGLTETYLSLLGFGGGLFYSPGKEAEPILTLSPIGLGLIFHISDIWSADAGVRMQAAVPTEGDLRLGAEIPLGLAYHF